MLVPMALSRYGPKKHVKPGSEGEACVLSGATLPKVAEALPMASVLILTGAVDRDRRPGSAIDRQHPKSKREQARDALVRVLTLRGRPIKRERGGVPNRAFRAAAGRYLIEHHYGACVKHARGCSARHIPLEDLIQAALLGAYTALERFDLDHADAYTFLSYAVWYIRLECNRLLHKDECLVHVPDAVRKARAALANTCPADVSDEEAAALLKMHVADVRAARTAHLGHEHRSLSESGGRGKRDRGGDGGSGSGGRAEAGVVGKALVDVRAAHDARAAELRAHAGLAAALATLDPLLRAVLHREYGVGEAESGHIAPPTSEGARRGLRNLALRKLREALSR